MRQDSWPVTSPCQGHESPGKAAERSKPKEAEETRHEVQHVILSRTLCVEGSPGAVSHAGGHGARWGLVSEVTRSCRDALAAGSSPSGRVWVSAGSSPRASREARLVRPPGAGGGSERSALAREGSAWRGSRSSQAARAAL